MEVIKNCLITQQDSKVLRSWLDDLGTQTYNSSQRYHTGVDLSATSVYAFCSCVCVYVGNDEKDKIAVIVQYDRNRAFRFSNLKSSDVTGGQPLPKGTKIGESDNFVHFELLTREESEWGVRAGKEDYWKHDPIEYARGDIDLDVSEESYVFYKVNPDIDINVDYGYIEKLEDREMTLQFISSNKVTVFEKKYGHRLNTTEVSYVCVPSKYRYKNKSAEDLIGYLVVIQDVTSNVACYCLVGDIAYNTNNWVFASQHVGVELGYSDSVVYGAKKIQSQFKIYGDFLNLPTDWGNLLNG